MFCVWSIKLSPQEPKNVIPHKMRSKLSLASIRHDVLCYSRWEIMAFLYSVSQINFSETPEYFCHFFWVSKKYSVLEKTNLRGRHTSDIHDNELYPVVLLSFCRIFWMLLVWLMLDLLVPLPCSENTCITMGSFPCLDGSFMF